MVMLYGVADGNTISEIMLPSSLKLGILQAEEQILERVQEEPDISTRRLATAVGVSQFVVH